MRPPVGSWLDRPVLVSVCFILTACVGITAIATSHGSYAVFGFIPLGLGIVIRQFQYKRRMIAMGTEVINEARLVSERFPDAYPAYLTRAVATFRKHGIAELIAHLPATK